MSAIERLHACLANCLSFPLKLLGHEVEVEEVEVELRGVLMAMKVGDG